MGAHSRRKGRGFENRVAGDLSSVSPATRISEAGLAGPDVLWLDRFWECKTRATYASLNYYAGQLEDNHGVILKEDRGPTLVLMRLDELLDILDERDAT